MQLGELILRERFGGEKVQRARVRIFQDRVQDRQVVAQRFSGSRRRNHDNVAPLPDGFRGHGLVAVQLRDAFFRIGVRQLRAHPFRHGRKLGLARRDMVHGGNDFAEAVALGELLDDFPDARQRDRVFRGPHRKRLSHSESPLSLRLLFATLTRRRRQRNGLSARVVQTISRWPQDYLHENFDVSRDRACIGPVSIGRVSGPVLL